MKASSVEKYFKQKSWSVPELICVFAIIVAIVFILAISIPIGVPLGGVAAVALVFIKSAKIKDAEVDRVLNSLIEAHGISLDPQNTIAVYDLKDTRVVKGKDGKLRSNRYVITTVHFGQTRKEMGVYRIELLTGQVTRETYSFAYTDEILLQEEAVMMPVGRRTVHSLISSAFNAPIPILMDDVHMANLVEKVRATSKK